MKYGLVLALPLLLLAFACGDEPSEFCQSVETENSACVNANNLADCEEANDRCPGRVLIQESCPLQFQCAE